ncbi:uncharacterized protein LOC129711677 [Leucoraja erinacea]|uniref:uncharacterized protein LOC129711677 n=1 Tax=Leucoraja erinaceus TaxID=7782 RepID=UPI0024556110|nr:uncharacterized protein LOC129711677 [Leucoraja erinacea]XP_055515489.1 uncharacterized protein LOC129711677 [Leucoraja erinacea]XP_055515499.1 uncharacterized protein LOC129711677 [Leucoraja erinacea]XP_055515509.1 uncharacterized protein LOC129711677 [Leucoraja erinacea]XP_055515519.1 uncharacterized protein LOC129711677 [Leucoraja erinacea]XP_055515528.1 uncharacterized protein LOC129711677 [Leucoraja erinacea]
MVISKLRRHFATFGSPVRLQTDNGRQFTSSEFQAFAAKWNFTHYTSSSKYPQSNGLAERAVCSAKNLLEQSRLSNGDFYLGLLNLCNISRDPTMRSPAQRLMSHMLRPPMPIAQQSLVPKVLQPATVQQRIDHKHEVQCCSHDKSCRPLAPLLPVQVVRMQTATGFSRLATVVGVDDSPRSYLVDFDGTVYRRRRQHLLAANEPQPPPADPYAPPLRFEPAVTNYPTAPCMPRSVRLPRSPPSALPGFGQMISSPARSPSPPSPPSPPPGSPVPAGSPPAFPVGSPPASSFPAAAAPPPLLSGGEGDGAIRTRSGRVVKPPVRYGDFV